MRSVSLRLQSLNQKTLTEYHRFITESFTRIRFWFSFDFDCTLTGQMGFKTDCGVRVWVWGEKVCPHTYPHHWNPDKQGASDEKWGCEGKKRKKSSPILAIYDRIVWSQWGLYTIHPMRRSRCFVFDNPLSLRSSNTSKPNRTVTPYMYIYLPNLCPSGLSVWV